MAPASQAAHAFEEALGARALENSTVEGNRGQGECLVDIAYPRNVECRRLADAAMRQAFAGTYPEQ
jgi:hypothetical protein